MTRHRPSFLSSLRATFHLFGWLLALEALLRVLLVPHFLLHSMSDRWELVGLGLIGVLGLTLVTGILHLPLQRGLRHGSSLGLSLWVMFFALDFSARNLIGSPFHSRAMLLAVGIFAGAVVVALLSELLQRRLAPVHERLVKRPLASAWVLLFLVVPFLPAAEPGGSRVPAEAQLVPATSGVERAVGPQAPDVIVVSIDTGRADLTEGSDPPMKALAELSAQGAVFGRAYAQENWTLPSHASIFTSLYPPVHGVEDLDSRLSAATVTFAQSFQVAGYRSLGLIDGDRKGFVGADRGFDRGFEHYVHYPDSRGVGEILLPFRWISDVLAFTDRGHAGDLVGNAVRWLGQDDERPALLFLHLYDVHASWGARWPLHRWPYMPRQPYLRQQGVEFPPRDQFQIDGASGAGYLREANERLKGGRPAADVVPDEDRELLRSLYNSSAAYVDAELSQLWQVLADRDRPFVLCVTSDHGEEFLEHGLLGHEQEYEECLRVPLVWVAPERVDIGQHGHVVELIDIAPTILELAELPIPPGYQGRSLAAEMSSGGASQDVASEDLEPDRTGLVYETDMEFGAGVAYAANEVDRIYALKTQRYSYLVKGRTGSEELYDLWDDPVELRDLLSIDAGANAPIDSLRTMLARWRADNLARREGGDKLELDDAARERLRSLGYIK